MPIEPPTIRPLSLPLQARRRKLLEYNTNSQRCGFRQSSVGLILVLPIDAAAITHRLRADNPWWDGVTDVVPIEWPKRAHYEVLAQLVTRPFIALWCFSVRGAYGRPPCCASSSRTPAGAATWLQCSSLSSPIPRCALPYSVPTATPWERSQRRPSSRSICTRHSSEIVRMFALQELTRGPRNDRRYDVWVETLPRRPLRDLVVSLFRSSLCGLRALNAPQPQPPRNPQSWQRQQIRGIDRVTHATGKEAAFAAGQGGPDLP